MSEAISNTLILEDPVFGKMEYKHSWYKTILVKWWQDRDVNVQISAHAYSGEGISDQQRDAFHEYQDTIDRVITNSITKIKEYIKTNYDLNLGDKEMFDSLTPSNVLFFKDGSWGILFDASFDIENGIALYKEKGAFKVGCQDEFL